MGEKFKREEEEVALCGRICELQPKVMAQETEVCRKTTIVQVLVVLYQVNAPTKECDAEITT